MISVENESAIEKILDEKNIEYTTINFSTKTFKKLCNERNIKYTEENLYGSADDTPIDISWFTYFILEEDVKNTSIDDIEDSILALLVTEDKDREMMSEEESTEFLKKIENA